MSHEINHENAHEVKKGDPRVDGPYLDDIRNSQQDEYRNKRDKDGTFRVHPNHNRGLDHLDVDDERVEQVEDEQEEDNSESFDADGPNSSEEEEETEQEEENGSASVNEEADTNKEEWKF